MKRVLALACMLHGCAASAPPAKPVVRPQGAAPTAVPAFALVMGEYGGYCLLLRGSVFCADLRFGEPLAKGPPVGGFDDVVQVELSSETRCVVRKSGVVHCTGANRRGQLGAGRREQELKTWPPVLGLGPVRSLALGSGTACAIETSGRVLCWGDNRSGQTGSHVAYADEANDLVRPSEVPQAKGARALSLTNTSSCALLATGSLGCWGEPFAFAPNNPSPISEERRKPVVLDHLGAFELIRENSVGRCGLTQEGGVVCLGNVDFVRPDERGMVLPLIPASKHLAMSDSHACAVTRDGAVWCFGRGNYGVLGRDLGESWELVEPSRVEGVPPARSVTTSALVSCATTRANEIYCWGGQLEGMGTVTNPPTKMRIE